MGKDMIYEPTSRTIHLRVDEHQVITLKGVWLQDHFQLRILFAQAPRDLNVTRSARRLILRLATRQVDVKDTDLQADDVIRGVDLFENLPDGSSEIHLRLGEKVLRYQIQPLSEDRTEMVVDLHGGFEIPEQYADTFGADEDYVGLRTIVLDPGHGGKDQGARGPTGLIEKDVTLDICRKLKRYLELSGEYEVILTRNGDFSLPLKVRTGVANNARADLFLSIHLNAIMRPDAWGSETYYLSLDESDAQSMTIEFENRDLAESLIEGESEQEIQDSDLEMMLWDLAQTEFVEDSFRVAKYIQEELNVLAGIRNRGVKQAPLKVLKGATMPAVLIEIAFISNPDEERKLRDYRFKQRAVRSIGRAITRYDADVRKRLGAVPQTVDGKTAMEEDRH